MTLIHISIRSSRAVHITVSFVFWWIYMHWTLISIRSSRFVHITVSFVFWWIYMHWILISIRSSRVVHITVSFVFWWIYMHWILISIRSSRVVHITVSFVFCWIYMHWILISIRSSRVAHITVSLQCHIDISIKNCPGSWVESIFNYYVFFFVLEGCTVQWRLWWNAALCCISSGFSLFAKYLVRYFQG